MGFGRYRFRRSFGQVKSQFRGARPKFYPLFTGLLDTYAGAAAAYSLRRLSKIASSVVRVRRASDNAEKDFTADNITDGAMVNWVNGQIVPPLDIRELDANGERTGALVEAAAAYSLRNLSSSFTGSVVEVRRSSDGEEDSFTASDVADGTLTDWVNTNTLSTARNYTTQPFETFTGASSSGFTASNSSANGFAGWDTDSGVSGNVIKVSFDLNITSGSPKISLRQAYNNNILASNENIEYTTSGSYTATLTASGNFSFIAFTEGDIPSSFTVSNFKILRDGFVSKWYDQSGNANHATQGTDASQPKIVDGGSLIPRGSASEPSILFGGAADDQLDVVGRPIAKSVFSALQASNTNFETLICDTADSIPRLTTNNNANNRAYKFAGFGTPSVNVDGVTYDGTSNVSSFNFHLLGMTSDTGSAINRIGANPSAGSTGNSFNYVSELIIYDSDQTDNRTAIEANIGETYGIDLPSGVDTGYDQVDGFVETWYDQSGNGNDAVQQVSGSQPKIVDAGSLVTGGLDFDGSNDGLSVSGQVLTSSSFYAASVVQHATGTTTGTVQTIHGQYQAATSGRFQLSANNSSEYAFFANATDSISGLGTGAIGTSQTLISVNADGSNAEIWRDGTNKATDTYSGFTPATVNFTIGIDSDGEREFNGKIAEIIVYPSDQTANRAAIEANINNQYDIY